MPSVFEKILDSDLFSHVKELHEDRYEDKQAKEYEWLRVANSFMYDGNYVLGEYCLIHAEKLTDKKAYVTNQYGLLYQSQGKPQETIEYFTQALSFDDSFPPNLFKTGKIILCH